VAGTSEPGAIRTILTHLGDTPEPLPDPFVAGPRTANYDLFTIAASHSRELAETLAFPSRSHFEATMRPIFARLARVSSRRRREAFSAQFDGGRSAAELCTSTHLGCDVLERRIVLTSSAGDFTFSQGTITGYTGNGGAVEIPSRMAGVPVTVIGEAAFQGNATITTLVIPDSVVVVYDRAFRGMSALESAKIGNGVTYVGDSAFQNSSRLATVSFGSRVTTIGNHAFDGVGLTAVTIPRTVTTIGNHAFVNNTSLTRVRFVGNSPHVGTDAFDGVAAGAKAVRAANLTGYGRSGGIWNNLIVTPPGRIAAPTVKVSTATLSQDASRITIRGTGFVSGVPAANTVTFDNGALGSVIAATATALTVSIDTPPSNTGPLKATVTTNIGGASGQPRQVATCRAEAPRFLSAFWGLDDGMPQQLCPTATALDGMPITFSWLIDPASIDPADFAVIRSDGQVTVPSCAMLRPANEPNETQTILLIGDFGDAASGVRPVRVRLVGQLVGSPPGSMRSEAFSSLISPPIRRLSAGPSIVDAWRIDPALLTNDANACTVGSAFVRVVWSGGITDYPTGNEVGVAVTRAYRLTYAFRGRTVTVAPLEIGDLNDGDNMHDLSFPAIPAGAKLLTITLPSRHVEDPNGDPNPAQVFRFSEPDFAPIGRRPSRR
jgi:putative transposon-encoded protein